MAAEMLKAKPEGNYAFIKGDKGDPNATFLFQGITEVLKEAMDAGKIKNVCETFTDGWKPDNAQKNMEQCLTSTDNKVDAVVSENDGMAGGVVAALEAQGLAGTVPVSGQDGDKAALNRVALGTQTVSVWKDSRALGKAAGEAAVAIADGADAADAAGRQQVQPAASKGVEVNAILLDAESDHQGQAQRRDRRRLDHQGKGLRRRHGRFGSGLRLIALASQSGVELIMAASLRRVARPFASEHEKSRAAKRPDGRGGSRCRRWRTALKARQLSEESAVRRFLRATEIDTRMLGMIGALLVIWVGFDILSGFVRPGDGLFGGSFLTPRNLWILLVQTSSIAVMTTGMVLIIVMRQIDLSVGSMLSFIAVSHRHAAGLLARPPLLGVGHPRSGSSPLLLGIAHRRRRSARSTASSSPMRGIPSFIVTLGGLIVWRGAAWWVIRGETVAPMDKTFKLIGGGIPAYAWLHRLRPGAGSSASSPARHRRRHPQRPPPAPALQVSAAPDLGRSTSSASSAALLALGVTLVVNSYPWARRASVDRYAAGEPAIARCRRKAASFISHRLSPSRC